MKTVVIVGAGPAGITAGIYAKKNKNRVIILEKESSPLKKLLLTGNGKCNYHNSDNNLSHYYSNNDVFLNNIINEKNLEDINFFFDSIGLVPKIKDGYYYPYSGISNFVKETLLKECELLGVEIKTNYTVAQIIKKDKFYIDNIEADAVILAAGGLSFIKDDYNGYDLAKEHKIIKPYPSLVKLIGDAPYFKKWEKVRCDACVSLYDNNELLKSELGIIQLTSSGISGICVYNLSNLVVKLFRENKKPLIKINFLPFIDDVFSFLENRNKILQKRTILENLEGLIHYKVVKVILKETNISENIFYNDLSLADKKRLISNLTAFPFFVKNLGDFKEAQVTNGGISLEEVKENLESKKCDNLYFAGEILDISGDCGGYNLTLAFITGMIAGRDIL